eukprot:SAG11_NODE_9886_length_872_cov_1.523933_1_plen_89_part_10
MHAIFGELELAGRCAATLGVRWDGCEHAYRSWGAGGSLADDLAAMQRAMDTPGAKVPSMVALRDVREAAEAALGAAVGGVVAALDAPHL